MRQANGFMILAGAAVLVGCATQAPAPAPAPAPTPVAAAVVAHPNTVVVSKNENVAAYT